jgi:hypothetical protein
MGVSVRATSDRAARGCDARAFHADRRNTFACQPSSPFPLQASTSNDQPSAENAKYCILSTEPSNNAPPNGTFEGPLVPPQSVYTLIAVNEQGQQSPPQTLTLGWALAGDWPGSSSNLIDLAFSSDGSRLYVANNNQVAVFAPTAGERDAGADLAQRGGIEDLDLGRRLVAVGVETGRGDVEASSGRSCPAGSAVELRCRRPMLRRAPPASLRDAKLGRPRISKRERN